MNKLYADDKLMCMTPDEEEHMPDWFEPKTNCRNCGAPLDKHKDCPYCGTVNQMKSGIVMTSDSISFFAG